MGWTSKPCPGCGKGGYRARQTGKVCYDCERTLKTANQIVRDREQLEEIGVRLIGLTGWWPSLSCKVPGQGTGLYDLEKEIEAALALIAQSFPRAFITPARRKAIPRHRKVDGWRQRVVMPTGAALGFTALHYGIEALAAACYALGLEKGQNLLRQLAAGEAVVGEEEQPRETEFYMKRWEKRERTFRRRVRRITEVLAERSKLMRED